MEVLVHPFSFREALRHVGAEPAKRFERLRSAERATLDQYLRRYLAEEGFPEAQRAAPRDRAALLGGYVDVLVLRDVIERHAVSNPLALGWIKRQLLANPGGSFSIKKHYDTLRSQGVSVGKETLRDYLEMAPTRRRSHPSIRGCIVCRYMYNSSGIGFSREVHHAILQTPPSR